MCEAYCKLVGILICLTPVFVVIGGMFIGVGNHLYSHNGRIYDEFCHRK